MTTAATKKASPTQGWSTRQTERPPKSAAIQPKSGVQIGMPVKRQTKNVTATVQ